jgi:DNA modification methylase
MSNATIIVGDVRQRLNDLDAGSVRTCITSPPYWGLRDYGNENQIGLEKTPEQYVAGMVEVFAGVHRVLADDATLWLNLGDSYVGTGSKGKYKDPKHAEGRNGQVVAVNNKVEGLRSKNLVGIPWRVAFALQEFGWYLRQDIIWAKPNPMPESVTDRCTKSHEYLFLLSKSPKYYYDDFAIKEPTVTPNGLRNKRDVWTIPTKPFKGAHFAVMPEALVEPCVLAGSQQGDLVLDPFAGSGTVGVVALRHERNFVGIEVNLEYAQLAHDRIFNDGPLMNTVKLEDG